MAPRYQKRSRQILLGAVAVMMVTSVPAHADDSPDQSTAAEVWECPQADDIPLYTNRERPGCHAMVLRPISTVPPYPDRPYQPPLAETVVQPEYPIPSEDPEGDVVYGGFGSSALRYGGAYA